MTEHLIKPAGAIIRSIDIQYYIISSYGNLLCGLRFKDKDGNTLLQCGNFNAPNSTFINHTMAVNEDERVVGVRSKTENGYPGNQQDIEFLLCKLK